MRISSQDLQWLQFKGGRKPSKYHNKLTYIDDKCFRSKREANRYLVLKDLLREGKIFELKLQPRFPFPMGFEYRADFQYKRGDKIIVEDVKGFETDVFILKEKCFCYFYPDLELRIIK